MHLSCYLFYFWQNKFLNYITYNLWVHPISIFLRKRSITCDEHLNSSMQVLILWCHKPYNISPSHTPSLRSCRVPIPCVICGTECKYTTEPQINKMWTILNTWAADNAMKQGCGYGTWVQNHNVANFKKVGHGYDVYTEEVACMYICVYVYTHNTQCTDTNMRYKYEYNDTLWVGIIKLNLCIQYINIHYL